MNDTNEQMRAALALIAGHDRELVKGDAYNFRAIARAAIKRAPTIGFTCSEQENACEQEEGA